MKPSAAWDEILRYAQDDTHLGMDSHQDDILWIHSQNDSYRLIPATRRSGSMLSGFFHFPDTDPSPTGQ